MRKLSIFLLLAGVFYGCHNHTHLEEGVWRGELLLVEKSAPFLFELKNTGGDSAVVTLLNGAERVELSGVVISGDSITIPILAYDAYIKAFIGHEGMEGRFVKNYLENDPGVPFRAVFANKHRFEAVEKPSTTTIDGKWNVLFISESGDTTRNVGIFERRGSTVTGSVLTSYGDLRFLEGAYTENGAQLSAFAGLSPYLIEISFEGNDQFTGFFYTTRGKTKLLGNRNEEAGLADPYSLTRLREGQERLSFSLPNLAGDTVSINDERYRGKVIIVSILGSWCPNCLDEMEFLSPWHKANRNRGVEVIGLAFERKDDFAYATGALSRLRDRYDTKYEILFGGKVGTEATGKALPELEQVNGYPTTLFIDKKGKIRKIHTGFNGPATGLFHEEFKKEFNKLVDELLNE